jgi:dynein light intermediate chain
VQSISHEQIDRNHLRDLKDVFDYKLRDSKARMSSLCPVRRAIHSMLFDELLRQVAIDNPERGLLLLRIRDELQMTLDAYQSLYEAASDYGQMKLQEGTTGKPEMLSRIKDLTAENDALKKEVKRLQTKHLAILRCVEERQETDKKKFAEERAFWERTRQRLVAHLETVKQMQEAEKRALREGTA